MFFDESSNHVYLLSTNAIMTAKGGIVCAVYSCNNYSFSKNARSFFRFPRDVELCRRWVIRSERQDLYDIFKKYGPMYLNTNQRICSDHFTVDDFRNPNLLSQGLKKGAIPTKNLNRLDGEDDESTALQEDADEPREDHSTASEDSVFESANKRNISVHSKRRLAQRSQGSRSEYSEESNKLTPQEDEKGLDKDSTYDGSPFYCVMTLTTDEDGEMYVPSSGESCGNDLLRIEAEAARQKEAILLQKLLAAKKKLHVARRVICNQRTLLRRLRQENFKLRSCMKWPVCHSRSVMKRFKSKIPRIRPQSSSIYNNKFHSSIK